VVNRVAALKQGFITRATHLASLGMKAAAALKRARPARLLGLQVGFAALALAGVAQYSVPAALIIGGVCGIAAVEMQPK
jgi:hypothetical protein